MWFGELGARKKEGEDGQALGGIEGDACRMRKGFVNCELKKGEHGG